MIGTGRATVRGVWDIRRITHKQDLAEATIRMLLEGLKGEDRISELCRAEAKASASVVRRLIDATLPEGRLKVSHSP